MLISDNIFCITVLPSALNDEFSDIWESIGEVGSTCGVKVASSGVKIWYYDIDNAIINYGITNDRINCNL